MKQANEDGAASPKAPRVHNGTYTVSHETAGHYTVKLHTAKKGDLNGKRIISLLVGPDNTSDYRGVAFWDDISGVVRTWARFKHPDSHMRIDGSNWQRKSWSSYEQKLAIWCDLVLRGDGTSEEVNKWGDHPRGYWGGAGYRLLLEGRCVVCNRKLTDPLSIERGIGPTCEGRP